MHPNPKDTAKRLKDKFGDLASDVVDEIINIENQQKIGSIVFGVYAMKFWQSVKEELTKQK